MDPICRLAFITIGASELTSIPFGACPLKPVPLNESVIQRVLDLKNIGVLIHKSDICQTPSLGYHVYETRMGKDSCDSERAYILTADRGTRSVTEHVSAEMALTQKEVYNMLQGCCVDQFLQQLQITNS